MGERMNPALPISQQCRLLAGPRSSVYRRAAGGGWVGRLNRALPISRQCRLLAVPRSSVYRKPAEVSAEDLAIMALIDRHYLARPYYGSPPARGARVGQ